MKLKIIKKKKINFSKLKLNKKLNVIIRIYKKLNKNKLKVSSNVKIVKRLKKFIKKLTLYYPFILSKIPLKKLVSTLKKKKKA